MKKLELPYYDMQLVNELTGRLTDENYQNLWGRTSGKIKDFKDAITTNMLLEQSHRCAYCGSRLFENSPHRDHIAPKDIYHQWTFWPRNLVLACYACNTDRKKIYDPVADLGTSYETTTFKFVHPYMDDPKEHIKFVGHRTRILICSAKSSSKGQETIKLFDLTNPERSKQRAKDALFDSDVDHLHGKWLRLFEQVALSPLPERLVLKIGHSK